MTTVITTNINLEDNARVIKGLDSKIAELKELREEKVAEVKEIMTKANVNELQAGIFMFRLSEVVRRGLDTVRMKREFKSLYDSLLKQSTYYKFEVV